MTSLESPIRDFYRGKTILVTGFTGFIGKVLVEKLLRETEVKKIFVLIRPRNTSSGLKSIEERMKTILNERPFTFHEKTRTRLDRIFPVQGDISSAGLGLSEEDRRTLTENVQIVFHIAACVKFEAPLSTTLDQNVYGTENVFELCERMEHLVSLVHVSTAYSNCDQTGEIKECVYPMDMNIRNAMHVYRSLDTKSLDAISKEMIKEKPNSYIYTKALAESMIMEKFRSLPIAIARPSIVTEAVKEPAPGWVDVVHGASGITLAASVGLLQAVDWNYWGVTDYFPVDICSNALIAIGWITATDCNCEIRVYNLTSGSLNPAQWGQLFEVVRSMAVEYPTEKVMRPIMHPPRYKRAPFYYPLKRFIYHTFYAHFMDFIFQIFGYKKFLARITAKLDKSLDILQYFTTRSWSFRNDNYLELIEKMSSADRRDFYCDIRTVDWTEAMKACYFGIRRYLLKEDDSTIRRGRIRLFVIYLVYRLMQLLLLYLIWSYFVSQTGLAISVGDMVARLNDLGYGKILVGFSAAALVGCSLLPANKENH